ncbi:hypothetical protein ACFE04_030525 [Oxalis oulophora]
MSGAGVQITRGRGEDRLFTKARGVVYHHHHQTTDQLRRAKSDVTTTTTTPTQPKMKSVLVDYREPENRTDSVAEPAASNFERFLESITPSVPAHHLSKTMMVRDWRTTTTSDNEIQPYFLLGDLWESFREWSAYGVGVPLIMNDSDCVVQYYVPYLSAIQLYGAKLSVKSRRPGEDSDSDFRDSSSEGSSDSEADRRLHNAREHQNVTSDLSPRIDRLSLRDNLTALHEDCSSDEGESMNSQSYLLFEYFEHNLPFCREPLADKISDLACRFPTLKTLRSCDLSPSSWISVAWYPIYRIPTGPTLRDLDACFLTYHSLHTHGGAGISRLKFCINEGAQASQPPVSNFAAPSEMDGVCKLSLPVFGLASYKFKGSLWTSNTGCDRQLVNSLLQAAASWLRQLGASHPDFLFFCRR